MANTDLSKRDLLNGKWKDFLAGKGRGTIMISKEEERELRRNHEWCMFFEECQSRELEIEVLK